MDHNQYSRKATSDEVALRMACVDNPDDITARLILADKLQEDGCDKQADFIRTSIRAVFMSQRSSGSYADEIELAAQNALMLDLFGIEKGWPFEYFGDNCPLFKDYAPEIVQSTKNRRKEPRPCPGVSLRLNSGSVFVGLRRITHGNSSGIPFTGGVIFKNGLIDSLFLPTLPMIAFAGWLFKYHPIRFAFLTDRHPRYTHLVDEGNGEMECWGWRASLNPYINTAAQMIDSDSRDANTDFLPRCLIGAGLLSARSAGYPDAIVWLSRRIVSFGRASADAGPLHDARHHLSLAANPAFYQITAAGAGLGPTTGAIFGVGSSVEQHG